jgi:superoxide dismutase
MKKTLLIGLFAVIGIAVQSCKKETVNPASNSGSMTVKMTDSPGNYAGLTVNITKVEAFLSGSGWVTLSNQSQLVHVLDLTNGAQTTIASSNSLETGLYSRLRLTFSNENTLLLNEYSGTSSVQLSIAGETTIQKEVIIDEVVTVGVNTEVLLDFNVSQSIIQHLNEYLLQPIITEIEDPSTGVQGQVSGALQASITLQNSRMSYNTYINESGDFLIQGVEDGTYSLIAQAMVQSSGSIAQQSIQNVVVTDGKITQLGTIQF